MTEKGNYSEKDASELIRQVLEGVAYLHSQGKRLLLHIDITEAQEIYNPQTWMYKVSKANAHRVTLWISSCAGCYMHHRRVTVAVCCVMLTL